MSESKKYYLIKKYYNTIKSDGTRVWTKTMVYHAVAKGWITSDEYFSIVGEYYVR